ncbi:phage terminase small subunit [Filomicrobium insigne]|uniref:Phage terminase small subunit n=1 Tax=Filomicrobium insigne TaxID=418854 RepID=A0A1H0UIJ8_9HYPH|nr:terminase small subunit [Filomicrobium insigne]SDP66004.1 phage terminase small subunit [Filomicrobium insigne]
MRSLTEKQTRFVEEFLRDLNATQAAIRAGYSGKTANQIGPKLLDREHVRAAIDSAKALRSERTKIDADWVLQRLVAEAEADVADLYGDDGDLRPVEEWPHIWRQGLVQGIDVQVVEVEGEPVATIKKLRLSDRVRRLEMIGKHVTVNAFQEVLQHRSLEGLAVRLDRARKRVGHLQHLANAGVAADTEDA